jgi:hypothetical protein
MLYLVSLRSQRPIFLSLSCTEFVLNFRSALCSVVSHLFFRASFLFVLPFRSRSRLTFRRAKKALVALSISFKQIRCGIDAENS